MKWRVKYGFGNSNQRRFPPSSSDCSVPGTLVQMKKKKIHLVLRKALEISSASGRIGTLDLWSRTKVEFELYPPSESEAEVIGQNAFKCQECYY